MQPHHKKTDGLDEQQAVLVAGLIALIDQSYSNHPTVFPRAEANEMIERFVRCGLATVGHFGGADSLTMLGIGATATGTAYGLLRNWQSAARARLREGVRA